MNGGGRAQRNVWGTKLDLAQGFPLDKDDSFGSIWFNTAWSPPVLN